jgi:hypothetical protein
VRQGFFYGVGNPTPVAAGTPGAERVGFRVVAQVFPPPKRMKALDIVQMAAEAAGRFALEKRVPVVSRSLPEVSEHAGIPGAHRVNP